MAQPRQSVGGRTGRWSDGRRIFARALFIPRLFQSSREAKTSSFSRSTQQAAAGRRRVSPRRGSCDITLPLAWRLLACSGRGGVRCHAVDCPHCTHFPARASVEKRSGNRDHSRQRSRKLETTGRATTGPTLPATRNPNNEHRPSIGPPSRHHPPTLLHSAQTTA